MIAARYASLIAFAQARAFCPRGEGNGIDNSCGSKTMSAPDRDGSGGSSPSATPGDTWGDNKWAWDEGVRPEGIAHVGNVMVMAGRTASDVATLAGSMGIKGPAELLTIGACNLKDADVRISGLGSSVLTLRADIPVGEGKIKIDTALSKSDGGPTINYGYFNLDDTARKEALADPSIQTKYAGKIFDTMLASMEAAEKAGFVEADTHAEGRGPGNSTSGARTDLQGYRLWGRFGFDGEVPKGWFSRASKNGVDVPSALSPDDRKELEKKGSISLQQLLRTKQGENIWKQWGIPIELTFDFKEKDSIGYQRYQKMLSLAKRAKQDRALFFEYVAGLEMREDPALWSGFVEERGFCPTGEGNGIDNSCGAKTMSAPDKDGGGGSSAASSVVFSSSTTAKLRDGDTIDASDEDADENVAAINWQAAEEIGSGNPELQQAVYKYSAGPHEVNGYFRYGESLDEYAENIGSTPEKLAASASATESAITTIAAAANPDGRELTSFRGLMNRSQNREYIEAIKSVSVGDVIKEAGVFSTSASLRRASMAFTSQDEGVIFRVKGKGGAPIAHVANYKDEWEVAYPNRSKFVVTSVARNVSVRISDSHRLTNVTFIDIREAD
jgi:hypothetical protein